MEKSQTPQPRSKAYAIQLFKDKQGDNSSNWNEKHARFQGSLAITIQLLALWENSSETYLMKLRMA